MLRLFLTLSLVGGCLWLHETTAAAASRTVLPVDGEEVVILRDGYGVPHVFGPSERAVYFGNGYAVAQDRMAQMEKYRRAGRGEMAELVGPSAVEADTETRREGYKEAEREAQFRRLPAHLQVALQAYADGVNAYITEMEKSDAPAEVRKLGVAIRPWKPTDSLAVGHMMARRFGGGDGGELRNLQVLNFLKLRFGDQAMPIFDDLLWKNDPAAPTTIPASESSPPGQRASAGLESIANCKLQIANCRLTCDTDGLSCDSLQNATDLQSRGHKFGTCAIGADTLLAPSPPLTICNLQFAICHVFQHTKAPDPAVLESAIRAVSRAPQMELARRHGLPTRLGSYAIAVAPGKSASGRAMLVGGPQMGFATPQIAHEVHLSAPGLDVMGMGFGGIPGVLIGHNDRIAWSTTTGNADQTDVFVEELNPENRLQYLFKGQWRDMEKRTETIPVRGGAPVTVECYRTVHGPVIRFDEAAHRAYSQASTYWGHENDALDAIYDFNRARDIREFGAAAAKIATSHNWLCATQDGDIGYWFVGRAPIRADGIDPRFPTPGTGDCEWKGMRPFAEMPQILNPKQGFLANWNNKPVAWWENSDTPVWGAVFRVQRILERLEEKPVLTLEDVKSILPDIGLYDPNARHFKPILLAAVRQAGSTADERLREAARLLEAWDNKAVDGSVAKTIYDAWMRELRPAVFADEIGLAEIPPDIERALQPSLLLRALEGTKASVPLSRDYLNGKSAAQVALEALQKALERLAQERGPQMNLWTYAQPRTRLSPLPEIPAYSRGTYLLIAELSKPRIRGESILPPGQSEDPASPHYSDQRELASWWMYKPLVTEREALEKLAAPEDKVTR